MLSTERPAAFSLGLRTRFDRPVIKIHLDASTGMEPSYAMPHAGPISCRAPCLCLTSHVVHTSCLALRAAHASHCALLRQCQQAFIGAAVSRWAHVATVYFMRFRYMLHMDVIKVDLVLHMLKWLCTCVASICFKCFSYFKRMLQVFHLDVAYVVVAIHVRCKYVFQMFQLFYLGVACFHLNIAYVAVTIHVCCKCMF
jgi:hypothetical protein